MLIQVTTRPAEPLLARVARLGRPAVPEELARLVDQAMSRDPADRPPDAGVLAKGLADWLDGARRRDAALALVAESDTLAPRVVELRAQADERRADAAAVRKRVAPAAPVAEKLPIWDAEDAAERLDADARRLETQRLETLRSALTYVPELPEAHDRLADHYRARHAAAEIARDRGATVEYETLLRAHDRGRHAAWLQGDGALTLHTDPPGAEARLHRYVERERRLVPEFVRSLGLTPIDEVTLPAGSWLVTLHLPDRPVVYYPVAIGRLQHWDGAPPGAPPPLPVALPLALPPDDVYVPAGWA